MTEMTSRERILRTFRRQETDRMPMVDSAWAGTVQRWEREGLPAGVDWETYFGFDKIVRLFPDNSPRFPSRIVSEDENSITHTTSWGMTLRDFKVPDSTPQALDAYVNTKERWEEAKARMLDGAEDRIPWDGLKVWYPQWRAEGRFLQLGLWFGFDVTHSHMTGTETLLLAMYDDPEWVEDMFDTYLTIAIRQCTAILDAGYEFDSMFWYDDMGYKGSTFFSPALYRSMLKPYHKRAVDWAHEHGLVTELHSCGYIEPLLPDLYEIGLDMLNPLEVKAGMDPHRLKQRFGDRLAFHGGINAQLWDKPDEVEAEMKRVIPIMREGGGYVFASDHSIPNSVSFEQMTRIVELAKQLGKN